MRGASQAQSCPLPWLPQAARLSRPHLALSPRIDAWGRFRGTHGLPGLKLPARLPVGDEKPNPSPTFKHQTTPSPVNTILAPGEQLADGFGRPVPVGSIVESFDQGVDDSRFTHLSRPGGWGLAAVGAGRRFGAGGGLAYQAAGVHKEPARTFFGSAVGRVRRAILSWLSSIHHR